MSNKVTRDGKGFIYVDGVKLGRVAEGKIEIKGCDRRKDTPNTTKIVRATIGEIATGMGSNIVQA